MSADTVLIIGGAPRSGSSALLTELNRHKGIKLIPEYDLPNIVRSLDAAFQKEVFFNKKKWISSVDRNAEKSQKIEHFESTVPTGKNLWPLTSYIFESTFSSPDLRVIGEKYPRHWILDLAALGAYPGMNKKFIAVHRDPIQVQKSYSHRANLTAQSQDLWSYSGEADGIFHWLQSWLYSEIMHAELKNFECVEYIYEDLKDVFVQQDLLAFVGLEGQFTSSFVPALSDGNHGQIGKYYIVDEISSAWHEGGILQQRARFDLRYFRRRMFKWLVVSPFANKLGKLKILIFLLFPSLFYKAQRWGHRYRFHSWMLRSVFSNRAGSSEK